MHFVIARDLVLDSGKYMLCVFAMWNESAHKFDGAKDSYFRVLSQTDLRMTEVDQEEGKKVWMKAKISESYDEWLDYQWNERKSKSPMNKK